MGLVQYDSSDEDEEVQTPVERQVRHLTHILSLLKSMLIYRLAAAETTSPGVFIEHQKCSA
jgi:hypothetical protein